MVDRAYKTGDASVDMKNGAKDMGHDVKNNMKDAYHEAKAGMNERKAEDAAAKREHEEAQRTGDPRPLCARSSTSSARMRRAKDSWSPSKSPSARPARLSKMPPSMPRTT